MNDLEWLQAAGFIVVGSTALVLLVAGLITLGKFVIGVSKRDEPE